MPDQRRKKRIEELIQRELGRILLSHPRQPLFPKMTITAVTVAPDLAVAKIFFSVFEEVDVTAAKTVLQCEAGFLRKTLAHDLNLRLTPKLNFIYDESIRRGQKLAKLIDAAIAADESKHHE